MPRPRRLPRILLNAATVLSAAICLGVLSLRATQGKSLLAHTPTAHMPAQDGTRLNFCRAQSPAWGADANFGYFAGIKRDAAGLVAVSEAESHDMGACGI